MYSRRFRGRGIDENCVQKKLFRKNWKDERPIAGCRFMCEDNIKIEFRKIGNEGDKGTLNSETGCYP